MKRTILLLLAATISTLPAIAQKRGKKKKGSPAPAIEAPKPDNKKPSIASKTKTCVRMDGLLTIFKDTTNGQLYMLIKKDQLDKEFIHFTYTENGVLAAGYHRGQFRGSRVFKISRYYDQIDFEQQNTGFYFNPENEISKSADANIGHSLLASEKIVGWDEAKGEYLISADELFLSEKLHQIKPSPSPFPGGRGFSLGMLSKSKTRFENIKNYPENTDFIVNYVFDNPYPTNGGGEDVTDARAVNVLMQHSFIQMPENNFKPRLDDARIGYFAEQVNDMTSTEAVNYRDLIHRWDLQKKDTTLEKSEPVKPIVWWIENTTPKEYRETIKAAALEWNKAFEPLGFVNAVQIFEQPDSADWDAGDIRYNVLRWTSSPNPPFGGYGPSFVNPRTGEILGADIMLEYIFVTNRVNVEKLFQVNSNESHYCEAGNHLHTEALTGAEMLKATGAGQEEVSQLVKQSLFYLILHEMGHTLGLQHNMKASQLRTPSELKNPQLILEKGLIGSVMDYPAINLNGVKGQSGRYCQTEPGPYDMWAIEYGYSIGSDDEETEQQRLNKILSRSGEKELTFGNDADDMRAPGKAIDPRVNVNDLSSDAIAYAEERMIEIQKLLTGLKSRYSEGKSYQELKNAFGVLAAGHAGMVSIVSRYVGGVYVERIAPGSADTTPAYRAVSLADQKRAMQTLNRYAFSPNAFTIPSDLSAYLQSQRRGYNFFGTTENPKLLNIHESIQNQALDHIMHYETMKRISESTAYGNLYSLSDMLSDLTNAAFKADLTSAVSLPRQILQINYVTRLIQISNDSPVNPYDAISQSRALAQLIEIQKLMSSNPGTDKETKEHRIYINFLIDKALKNN